MRTQPWPLVVFCCLLSCALVAQVAPARGVPQAGAVSPAAPIDLELSRLLRQIEQSASSINLDLGKLRVEKWKADSANKRETESTIDSVQRNLTAALPEFITAVRNSPRNLAPEFRLYRNLDTLADVLNSVAESAGAFGAKDQFEHLAADISGLEAARTALGKHVESSAEAQALELSQLRQQLLQVKAQQAAPAKTVVDNNATTKSKSTPRKKPKPTPSSQTPQSQPPQ